MKTITYDDTKYTLVPIEPNLEMVIAGENYIGRHAYKRMLAAAPTPTTEAQAVSSEPFRYCYMVNGTHELYSDTVPPDDAYDEGSLIPLYTTPNHRAVMGQALEALEAAMSDSDPYINKSIEAIAALKQALGEQG